MPAQKQKAEEVKAGMEKLAPEMQAKIQERFADTGALVSDVVDRMDKHDVPFPDALMAAVKDKDPGLAAELEKTFSAAEAEAAPGAQQGKAEAAPQPGEATAQPEEAGEEKPAVEAEVTLSAGAGVVGKKPIATAAAATEVSIGENVVIDAGATAVKDLQSAEGIDYGWSAGTCVGDACMAVYRDPTTDVAIAGTASYYVEVSEKGVGVEPGAEVGQDTEGGEYVTVYSSVSYENEEHDLSTYVTPMLTIPIEAQPAPAFGFEAGIAKGLGKGFSVEGKVYMYDVTAGDVTATVVIGKTF